MAGFNGGNTMVRNQVANYLGYKAQCDNGVGNCFPVNTQISDYATSGTNTLPYTDTASLLLNNGRLVLIILIPIVIPRKTG